MNKAYKYDDYLTSGESSSDETAVFHELSNSDNRMNVFILKDINEDMEDFREELPQFTVNFVYPQQIYLKVNNEKLTYTMKNGQRLSMVANVEYGNTLKIDVVPSGNYRYVVDLDNNNYNSAHIEDVIVLSNIIGDITITIREQTDRTTIVHYMCESTIGLEEIAINSIPVDFGESFNESYNYSANDRTYIDLSFLPSENYMIDSCRAYVNAACTDSASITRQGDDNHYRLNITQQRNNSVVTEYWVRFSVKRISDNDYVIQMNFNHEHIASFVAGATRINSPVKDIYLIYVDRDTNELQVTVTAKSGCTLLQRSGHTVNTNINSNSDSFILRFNSSKYGESNPYIIGYTSHNSVDDVYRRVTIKGLAHATVTVNSDPLEKSAMGTDYVSSFNLLEGSIANVCIYADDGYRISQNPYILSGTGQLQDVNLSSDKLSAWFDIKNVTSDVTVAVSVVEIPKYTVTYVCPNGVNLSFTGVTADQSTVSGVTRYVVSNVLEDSGVVATISHDYEYTYAVTGTCSKSVVNDRMTLRNIKSNVTVEFSKRLNNTCVVHFWVNPTGISQLVIDSTYYNVADFSQVSLTGFTNFKSKTLTVGDITNATRLLFKPIYINNYELNTYICAKNSADGSGMESIQSDLSFEGESFYLRFSKYENADNELEYPTDIYVMLSAKAIVSGEYTIELHIIPGHISSVRGMYTNNETAIYDPTDSCIVYKVTSNGNSSQNCRIDYTINNDVCDFVNVTVDGNIITSTGQIPITLTSDRLGVDSPYVVYINTESLNHTITVHGLGHIIDGYWVNYNATNMSDSLVPLMVNNVNSDRRATFEISKTATETGLFLRYDESCVFGGATLRSGNGTVGDPDIINNEEGDYIVSFEIKAITSDIEIDVDIRPQEQWNKAEFYALSSLLSYKWNEDEQGNYVYSGSIGPTTATRSLCVKYIKGTDYKIIFNNSIPTTIYYRTGAKVTNNELVTGKQFTSISVDACDVDNLSVTIPRTLISNDATSQYLYLGFQGFPKVGSSNATPSIKDISYRVNSDYDSMGTTEPNFAAIFSANEIIDLQVIHEVDITGESVPYSSYSITVKDDRNSYNPMINETNKLYKNQVFELYSLVADMSTDDYIMMIQPDYYITKIGTARLSDISAGNSTAVIQFKGPLEYYDDQYLNDNELLLSSVKNKTRVKDYLRKIFGNDIDVSAFEDTDEITTPFYTDSKTQIARIIAQAFAMYLDENVDGKICFRTLNRNLIRTTDSDLFRLALEIQKENPQITKVAEPIDGVKVKVHRNKIGAYEEVKIFDSVELYVKSIEESDEGSDIDDGSNITGYKMAFTAENGAETAYDEEGNLQTTTNLDKALLPFTNVKFIRIRFNFGKKYHIDSLVFEDSIWDGAKFKNIKSQSAEDIVFNYAVMDYTHSGNPKESGCCVTESFIDFWFTNDFAAKIYLNGDVAAMSEDDIQRSENPTASLTFFYYLAIGFLLGQPRGCPIETDEYYYNYHPIATANNIYEVDNPLITSSTQAEILAMYLYIQKNKRIYEANVTWRGDCTVCASDNILTGIPLGFSDGKSYDNYCEGTVVKNDIDYNGGLSENTIIALPNEKLSEKNGITDGDDVTSKVGSNLNITQQGIII